MTAAALPVRPARPNGWWGMTVFVASEATLFGTLIGTYVYLGLHNVHWPPQHLPRPPVLTPALLTGALVLTSIPMQLAWRAARDGRRAAAWRLLLLAFGVQLVYLVWQLHDFVHLVHVYPPRETAWASVYITLLGTDHAHVLAGLLLNAWLLVRIASRLTHYRLVGLWATTFYWHAVNVITAVVLAVQVSPYL
jgi:cytochrome c oxidase subunit 3/cytochrome c oxidase subunit I+III